MDCKTKQFLLGVYFIDKILSIIKLFPQFCLFGLFLTKKTTKLFVKNVRNIRQALPAANP